MVRGFCRRAISSRVTSKKLVMFWKWKFCIPTVKIISSVISSPL